MDDELNITDRLNLHNCQGFIGFYSTLPNSSLNRSLRSYEDRFQINVFNQESIESILLEGKQEMQLIKRYFLQTFLAINNSDSLPSNLFAAYETLNCDVCQKDLLKPEMKGLGIIVFVEKPNDNFTFDECVDIYCVCKGKCDTLLETTINTEYITK
ncbi:hypothetical protein [Ectobacillus sp. sgz5001026]|uniref:hypothetical protein n=1 Tax=Ectobacillus sp. sgz5001026 TaxID=3242473 RepID=UPI0036D3C82C